MPAQTVSGSPVALSGGIPVPGAHCTVRSTTCPLAAGDQIDGGEDETAGQRNSTKIQFKFVVGD